MDAQVIERILAPIREGQPTGENIDLAPGDVTINHIEELRREEDAFGSPDGTAKEADWNRVVRECGEALATRSKHLDVVRYLVEAMVRTDGFAGLEAGLRITRELLDRYWESLYPGLENGKLDLEIRARPISWLGDASDFIVAVKQIPWANGRVDLSWSAYEKALQRSEAEAFRKSLDGLPTRTLDSVIVSIQASRTELELLVAICRQKFGGVSPEFATLRDLLDEELAVLNTRSRGNVEPGRVKHEDGSPGETTYGPIRSREEALQWLQDASDYLARTEPHSPVPHLLNRAIRWSKMSFEDLMQDVIKKEDVRSQVWEVLGLPKRDKPS